MLITIIATFVTIAAASGQDCVGTWGAWEACSGTCGQPCSQKRTYIVQIPACATGAPCPFKNGDVQTQPCTLQCPQNDCVGAWEAPTPCVSDGVCGSAAGKQTRRYKHSKPQGPGGKPCPVADGTVETLPCSAPITPCACCEGAFGAWSTCKAVDACGSDLGTQDRVYKITKNPAGGTPCPFADGFKQSQRCQVPLVPCKPCVGSFGPATACVSKGQCGSSAGTRKKTYTITEAGDANGAKCPYANGQVVEEACDAPVTPCVDCKGTWSAYTECKSDGVCGSAFGKRSRTYTVTQPCGQGALAGVQCPAANGFVEVSRCTAPVTPCKGCVGSWSAWSACASKGQCGCDAGLRSRSYTITEPGEAGGAKCEATNGAKQEEACKAAIVPCAPVDGEGSFGEFGACRVATCGTTVGTKSRTFRVTKAPAHGGKPCAHENGYVETVPCEGTLRPCPQDCVGKFGAPSECQSKGVCGSAAGTQTETFVVSVQAANGGKACQHANGFTQTKECLAPITPCPPVDCQGAWSAGACSAPCGTATGQRTLTFRISRNSAYGGKCCEALNGQTKTEQCQVASVTPCPIPCIGQLSEYSACKSSGICSSPAGTTTRVFKVTQKAQFGGKECSRPDGLVETTACNTAPITPCPPEPCVGSWVRGTCKQSACGNAAGVAEEVFRIAKQCRYGGAVCPNVDGDKRTVPCQAAPVKPCPVNCVGKYSDFSACKALAPCGTRRGEQSRTFSVSTPAKYGGIECPVANGHVDVLACPVPLVICPAVDCQGSWSAATPCKQAKCDRFEGTSTQTYTVSRAASVQSETQHGGKACEAKTGDVKTSACTVSDLQRCPIHCVGAWSPASPCVPDEECGCAKGHQFKTFKHSVSAQFGGRQCPAKDGERVDLPCAIPAKDVKRCPNAILDAPCEEVGDLLKTAKSLRCKVEAILNALSK